MKILIVYASRGGATRTCAQLLCDKLKARFEVTLADARGEDNIPSPDDYDIIAIGSPIRMGHIDKNIRSFIKANKDAICAKPSAFFFCCGFPAEADYYIETQIPKDVDFSLGCHCFGGELKPEKLKGIDRLIVKTARKKINSQDFEESDRDHIPLPELLPEAVSRLADKIRELA